MLIALKVLLELVAPFAGAWIEIIRCLGKRNKKNVAPFAGAWIEIISNDVEEKNLSSRTLRGCVD